MPASQLDTPAPRHDASAVRRTLAIILALNILVVGIKFAVGIRAHALSVLGAALESTLDLLNNVIAILLVSVAARGPDDDHPYGHEKFETLGALAIIGFLSISCFEMLREAIEQLIGGSRALVPTGFELALIAGTIIVNACVVWLETRRGRELGSAILLADAAHTRTDIWVTALAISSLALARFGWGRLDPWLAIIVAITIATSGWRILRETVPILVDERGVDPAEIRSAIASIQEISDVRRVRSRRTPSGILLAEVTVGVHAETSVAHAHQLADAVEDAVRERLGSSEVVVHVEPT